jgi:hypothetical protein
MTGLPKAAMVSALWSSAKMKTTFGGTAEAARKELSVKNQSKSITRGDRIRKGVNQI